MRSVHSSQQGNDAPPIDPVPVPEDEAATTSTCRGLSHLLPGWAVTGVQRRALPDYDVPGQLLLDGTSLDPQQTTLQAKKNVSPGNSRPRGCGREFAKKAEREACRVPPPAACEVIFRHGGWQRDRARVDAALVAAGASCGRLERFRSCGTDCIVEFSPSLMKHRVRATYCGDRFCVPCSVARAMKIRPAVLKTFEGRSVRMITLTLKHQEEPLAHSLRRLYDGFTRLRRTPLWRSCVTGGVGFCELTRGKSGRDWHAHLHCLCCGKFVDQAALSDAWRVATGGSYVVDVRACRDHVSALCYLTQYVTKGWSHAVYADPDALCELVCALRGRRLFNRFGNCRLLGPSDSGCEVRDWVRVGTLQSVVSESLGGAHWAIGVCRSLNIWFALDGARPQGISSG